MRKYIVFCCFLIQMNLSYADTEKLCGIYYLRANLGGSHFDDLLVIDSADPRLSDTHFDVRGSYTFPGYFTVKIQKARATEKFLSFEIEVNEGKGAKSYIFEGFFGKMGTIYSGSQRLGHYELELLKQLSCNGP